ncbi:Protein ZBED8 [Eumeta japonica]|uniref:Protein ZBED8 n=1 Tax=Eumeta variegata TaxID=151549 RepID=A0A4C1TCV8_EUMVA|nr:Protein ZBED8 [Eumeta japonica]
MRSIPPLCGQRQNSSRELYVRVSSRRRRLAHHRPRHPLAHSVAARRTLFKKMSKKRKYDESYVNFGFTFVTERDGTQKPQCFLCGKVLANGSMKPAKLSEHLKTVHPGNIHPTQNHVLRHRTRLLTVLLSKKPHTIAETLVKPCALDIVELVCGKNERKKVEAVPLSNDVIHSRIVEMSSNVLKQVIEELNASPFPFSMQLDESTDVSQCSQLLVFVRYVKHDTRSIKEEFLFCDSLLETTKASDVFEMIKKFFIAQNVDWKTKLGSICTDGTPAMLGLAYLADIFTHLNEINLSLQGPAVTIVDASERLKGFRRLLKVISAQSRLKRNMGAEPILIDIDSISDEDLIKDDLIDMRSKEVLKAEFQAKDLGDFWGSLSQAYPLLVKRAMSILIPFATTYLCEAGFSILMSIKTKSRNRLNVADDMRLALSKTVPQINVLIEAKQQHPSH